MLNKRIFFIFAIGLLSFGFLIGCQPSEDTSTLMESPPVVIEVTVPPEIIEVTRIVEVESDTPAQTIHPPTCEANVIPFHSSIMNRDFVLYVGLPFDYDPEQTYPVIYVLDGDYMTEYAWPIATLLAFDNKMPQSIVVGIGYGNEMFEHLNGLRLVDFNGSRGDDFLRFMDEEAIPEIEARYSADPNNRTLIGHSLSGKVVLNMMYNKTDSFHRYIVGSPSESLKEMELVYAEDNRDLPINLYLAGGSMENVTLVEEAYNGLLAHDYPNLNMEMEVIEGETHMSLIPNLISHGLRSVFAN